MATKTATVTFRLAPGIREMLRVAAERERRTVANMIEVMVVEYAICRGIEEKDIKPSSAVSVKKKKPTIILGRGQEECVE